MCVCVYPQTPYSDHYQEEMKGDNSFLGRVGFSDYILNLGPRDKEEMREMKSDFCSSVCPINVVKLQFLQRAEHLPEISI